MNGKRDYSKVLKALGNKLYLLRRSQSKELESVARAVNISPVLLMRIERGDYDMYIDLLFELCDHYETRPYDLLKDIQDCGEFR